MFKNIKKMRRFKEKQMKRDLIQFRKSVYSGPEPGSLCDQYK